MQLLMHVLHKNKKLRFKKKKKMKISETKSYSLLESGSDSSELSIYEEYFLNPEHRVQITSKENERDEMPDHSSSISEAMSWSTDVHQKSVMANIDTHENSSFIQPCSVSIPRIDLEKYINERGSVDFSENISDPLNSSSCSSFDTRTDMYGIKLEMIQRYLDNCASDFGTENENQVSFLYDKKSSEITEDRNSFDLGSEEDCIPFSFAKQNNVDNSSVIERNNNACFTSVSSKCDYLNNLDVWNVSTANGILPEHFKNLSKSYNLKQCSVVVKKMNVDDWLISEYMNREKKALITDNSNCTEHDNLSHSSVQTESSFDHTENVSIKVEYKAFQNHNCFSDSEIDLVSLEGKTVLCSSKPSNGFDFESLQNEHENKIYSEDSRSERNKDAVFVKSARRKQMKMSKMKLEKKCKTKNIKNGDNSLSLCEISETEQKYHTKGARATNQRMRMSNPKNSRNFSQRKQDKILEFEKAISNAKQSNFITKTKLRFTDVHMPFNGRYLEKQNILKHKGKNYVVISNNTCEKENKLSLESNVKKISEYQECEPYFRKYENERMIKINCIKRETKDTFIPNTNKKVLSFTSKFTPQNIRNDKIKFNKTGFNLYSGSAGVLGNKKMNNYTLDNAKISMSCENDKELQVMENKYGLKPCSVPLLKLPLSLYTMQVSEYEDNFSCFFQKNSKKSNVHYSKTKIKTNNAKCNQEFKRKQMPKKTILSVGARKKYNTFVSKNVSFKLKPKVLRKSIEVIESCNESVVDMTEYSSDGSECKDELWYPKYKKKLQISTVESGKFKKNTESHILKFRKKQNMRDSELNKKKYEPVIQEASLRFRHRKRSCDSEISSGSEIIELESDTSACDSNVKKCHSDKTYENISDINECDNDIKKCLSDKTLENTKKFIGKEPRNFNAGKVSQKQSCKRFKIHGFPLIKDKNLKIVKSFVEKQVNCGMKNGKLKKETSAESVCFNNLEAKSYEERKQNCITRNEILAEVRGNDNAHKINSNTFMSVKCEGNYDKKIVQDCIVKFNKFSTGEKGKAKVYEMNSDTFVHEYNKHVLLEKLNEKYASVLKGYSIKPCVVVLEKLKLEEYQNDFEVKHESPFTENKIMKYSKSNSNNTNQLNIFKKAHSTCNTSLSTVEDKKIMIYKDMIDKENKNNLKVGICSFNCKPGRKDIKCCSKHVKTNKQFSTKLKPSGIKVGYNTKTFGETRKCQSEYAETAYKNKFRKVLSFAKTTFEEKKATDIAHTEKNLTKYGMIDSTEQYKVGREIKEGSKCSGKPLLEVGLNKDISTQTNCNLNKVNNYDSSMKNRERCKKCQFKSESNETYHGNKNKCGKTLMCIESVCEELKEQNLRGKLSKNIMAVGDNVDPSTLEEMTGKYSAYFENSRFLKRDRRKNISVDTKCKSRINKSEYNNSSEIFMNVKESGKGNHFKNKCHKNECFFHKNECRKTFAPAHVNHSRIFPNKNLKTDEDTNRSMCHAVDKPASLIDVGEGCFSFKSVTETNVKPVPYRTGYKRLRIPPSLQNMEKSRSCLMNNIMIEYHEPVKSIEMEELKPRSLFFNRDCDSVMETSTRNSIVNRNSSRMNKTLLHTYTYDKNMPINFDQQTVRGNIERNVNGQFKSRYENNRVIDYNAYKTKADNSSVSSLPEDDYHEVLRRSEKFTCFQCGKYVHSAKGLFYHKCPGKRAMGYICYFCEKIYLSLKELEQHKRIHKR